MSRRAACLVYSVMLARNYTAQLIFLFQLIPTEGMVRRHNHLKIGRYHQHLHELLDMDLDPISYICLLYTSPSPRDS